MSVGAQQDAAGMDRVFAGFRAEAGFERFEDRVFGFLVAPELIEADALKEAQVGAQRVFAVAEQLRVPPRSVRRAVPARPFASAARPCR